MLMASSKPESPVERNHKNVTSASATTYESFNVEDFERLVVPAEPDTHTFIPFGIDGTYVAIN